MLNNYTEVDFEKWATGRNFLKPFLFKSHREHRGHRENKR
jgi:hypothetical protein